MAPTASSGPLLSAKPCEKHVESIAFGCVALRGHQAFGFAEHNARRFRYLQCFSWHCWLHAAEFFIAKFLAHQLSQPAAHRADAALAWLNGTVVANINATMAITFILPSIEIKTQVFSVSSDAAWPASE
jgi:hypothetical protein